MSLPPLGELYDLLRGDGFPIGVDDHVRIGRLIAHDATWTPETLQVAVRALVVKDLRDRDRFEACWRRWLAGGVAVSPWANDPPIAPRIPSVAPPPSRRGWYLAAGVVAVGAIVATVVLTSGGAPSSTRDRPPPAVARAGRPDAGPVAARIDAGAAAPDAGPSPRSADGGTGEAPVEPAVARDVAPSPRIEQPTTLDETDAGVAPSTASLYSAPPPPEDAAPGWTLALGLAGVALFGVAGFAVVLLVRGRRRFLPGPWHYRANVPVATRPVLDREEIEDGAAHLTWRPSVEGGTELDADRSVARTVAAGGMPSLAYRPPPPAPEYLVLEDVGSTSARCRFVYDELLRGLAREGVRLVRYTFVGTPDECTSADGRTRTTLRDLAEHVDGLLVIGDGNAGLDAMTGEPAEWLQTLRHVPRRLWINPVPPARWSPGVRAIARDTPMEHGVARALVALHAGVDRRDAPRHAFPAVIERAPASDTGFHALREHLGPTALRLLGALATFGEPTVAAARWLAERFRLGLDEEAWLRVLSLPWLDTGKWPAGLRDRLIATLAASDPELARAVVDAAGDVVAASEPPVGSAAHLRWQLDVAVRGAERGQPAAARRASAALASTPMHAEAGRRLGLLGLRDHRGRALAAVVVLGVALAAIGVERATETRGTTATDPVETLGAVATDRGPAGMRRVVVDRVEVESQPDDRARIRLRVNAVDLEAMGTVLALEARDFELERDGARWPVPVEVAHFSDVPTPVGVVLLVQDAVGGQELLDHLGEAWRAAHFDRLPAGSRVAVMHFDDTGAWVGSKGAPGAVDFGAVEPGSLDEPELAEAVARALRLLESTGSVGRKLLVVIGNGEPRWVDRAAIGRLGDRADAAGIRIDTIAYDPEDDRQPMFALAELSLRSQGVFRWVQIAVDDNPFVVPLARLAQELTDQYVLTVDVPADQVPRALAVSAQMGDRRVASRPMTIPSRRCGDAACAAGDFCGSGACVRPGALQVGAIRWAVRLVAGAAGVAALLELLMFALARTRRPVRIAAAVIALALGLAAGVWLVECRDEARRAAPDAAPAALADAGPEVAVAAAPDAGPSTTLSRYWQPIAAADRDRAHAELLPAVKQEGLDDSVIDELLQQQLTVISDDTGCPGIEVDVINFTGTTHWNVAVTVNQTLAGKDPVPTVIHLPVLPGGQKVRVTVPCVEDYTSRYSSAPDGGGAISLDYQADGAIELTAALADDMIARRQDCADGSGGVVPATGPIDTLEAALTLVANADDALALVRAALLATGGQDDVDRAAKTRGDTMLADAQAALALERSAAPDAGVAATALATFQDAVARNDVAAMARAYRALGKTDRAAAKADYTRARNAWIDRQVAAAKDPCALQASVKATFPEMAATVAKRAPCVPAVAIGEPVASGTLDKALIRQYVKYHLQQVTYCYEQEHRKDASLAGTVNVAFVIDASTGKVTEADATGLNQAVSDCIEGVVLAIEFPSAKGGGLIHTSYPFIFQGSGDDGETTPAEECLDEVGCLLEDKPPACCKKYQSGGTTDAGGLTTAMIKKGMAPVLDQARACGVDHPANGIVSLRVTVSDSGAVTRVEVKSSPDVELGKCVTNAVDAAKFGKTKKGGSFTYPFEFSAKAGSGLIDK